MLLLLLAIRGIFERFTERVHRSLLMIVCRQWFPSRLGCGFKGDFPLAAGSRDFGIFLVNIHHTFCFHGPTTFYGQKKLYVVC